MRPERAKALGVKELKDAFSLSGRASSRQYPQGDALGYALMPFQGVHFRFNHPNGTALGYALMPFQGMP